MNKKLNTVFFIVAATIFEILVMLAFSIVYLLLLAQLPQSITEALGALSLLLVMTLSVLSAMVIYRLLLIYLQRKFDFSQYFSSIFPVRKNK